MPEASVYSMCLNATGVHLLCAMATSCHYPLLNARKGMLRADMLNDVDARGDGRDTRRHGEQ
jgi:hypothetical protein